MLHLDGYWLVGSWVVLYLVGVFTSQWVKDKATGVPSELRSALQTAESDAKAQLSAAKAKVVSSVSSMFKTPATAAAAPATPAVPAVATVQAPATPATPA